MKRKTKFILCILSIFVFFVICFSVFAQSESVELNFTPEVGFPGFDKQVTVNGSMFGNFIIALFNYLIYLAGIIAVIMIMIAGFEWVTAGGNQSKIRPAKNKIINALIGLFLCFASVLILKTINPDLISIKDLSLVYINVIQIEDYTEPITRTTNIVIDKSNAIPIPNNPAICKRAGINSYGTQNAVDKLIRAADCMKNKGLLLRLESGLRYEIDQQRIYKQNCGGSTICGAKPCSIPTCCPFKEGKMCPHNTGVAFDVQGVKDSCGANATAETQTALQDCMFEAGFCLWAGECWHFESTPMSSPCNTEHNQAKCSNIFSR